MWLIADSGSTKTDWILFDSKGEIAQVITTGLNRLFVSESEFKSIIKNSIPDDWFRKSTKVWFYGAGCGTERIKNDTNSRLESLFSNAEIVVESDLLGAAQATCGDSEGIVAILGTGSNSCYYDGNNIVKHIKPLGFILGDEGSGASIGKVLLRQLLRNQLSSHLSKLIYADLGMGYDEIIYKIYNGEWPNRFIASCARILHKYKEEPEISNILNNEFDIFASVLATYNLPYNVHFVGSVAYFFKPYLEESLQKRGLRIGKVLKSPANQLMKYHLKNG